MSFSMPRHPLPSHGRIDLPSDAPQPFRVIPVTPAGGQQVPASQPPTVSELVHRGMHAFNDGYAEYHARAANRDGVTPEQILQDLKSYDTKPLDEWEQISEDRVKLVQRDYDQLVKAKRDGVDDNSYTRICNRLKDKLEQSSAPVSTAQDIIARAPAEELGVVLQEVGPWLENRGHAVDFIPAALNQNPAAADVRAAAETLTKARQAAVISHQTARAIRIGIQNGAPAKVLMSIDDAARYDPDRK